MAQYKDKNGTTLKIGDSILDKKGNIYRLENRGGASMGVIYLNDRPVKTVVMQKLDTESMERL